MAFSYFDFTPLWTFQVIDTPGILDHSLEERNTIEMQAITALAHLRAAVLYFTDLSEQCGYTLSQQVCPVSKLCHRTFKNTTKTLHRYHASDFNGRELGYAVIPAVLHCLLLCLQIELFENIKPLFAHKPLIVVANKTDVKTLNELSDENKV